jgi:ATP-dependent exoDNAse (exonuclease V) beta subunit
MKKKPVVAPLSDEEARRSFHEVHNRNISVIAPAGVGKTRGIVNRILQLARDPRAAEILPRLVVVTFSVAAAQEMQSRARVSLRGGNLPLRVQRAFQQTFFGTIHSFCVQLLSRFGHHLGLPGALTLPRSDDELWERFLVHGARRDPSAELPALRDLFHFYTVAQLYGLGRTVAPSDERPVEPLLLPNLRALIDFPTGSLHASTRRAVATRQEQLTAWNEAWSSGDRFHPLPGCCENPPDFVNLWRDTFAPLNDWLRRGALEFGRRVANDFAAFRRREGVMTYNDQVRLALAAIKTPAAREELRRERWSVLLDEAQDTDKEQFEILARVAGLPPEDPSQAPGQTLCIVGDFQQAIWGPRSDLDVYKAMHVEMIKEPTGMAIELTVTFRCDRAIIDFVNRLFHPLLDAETGQAKFVPLQSRPAAGEGQVVRWMCPLLPAMEGKITAEDRARHEAHFLAGEIKRLGPVGLGAERWQDIAILCPRRDWLRIIERALRQADVDTQLHSADESQASSTPRAWLTALVWVAAHPEDAFEVAGALRDIFGVADDAMARFTGGDGDLLRLDRFTKTGQGEIAQALATLHHACENAEARPLHRMARQLIDRTRLRDRIVALEEEHADLVDRELEEILALIDRRAAEGQTLRELAQELRESLGKASTASEEVREAVQLFTWHKAKGLEWQTVIVPFVFRSFGEKESPYPRVVVGSGGETLYRDGADYKENARAFVQHRASQQFQRLLYVACTRPRHTLLFLDDESVFAGAERELPYVAAKLLRLDQEPARTTWRELPNRIDPWAAPTPVAIAPPGLVPPCPPLSRRDFEAALARARDIPRRITPHELAIHPPPEAEPERSAERDEPAANSPAILYGTWWHELMEAVPWEEPSARWTDAFEAALPQSPQPARARREWKTLRASSLAKWLATPGLVIQRELPFLWPSADRCLEGVMDLAVFDPATSAWKVIDWKTNRTDATALVAVYRDQVAAYVEALRALLRVPVTGSFYLTATGEWIGLEASAAGASGTT